MGQKGHIPSEGSRGELIFLPFLALKGTCIPWFMASFSTFNARNITSSNLYSSVITMPSASDPLIAFLLRPLWLNRPHSYNPEQCSHLKILNLITSTKFFLPWKVRYLRFGGLGCGHLWWAIIQHFTVHPLWYLNA